MVPMLPASRPGVWLGMADSTVTGGQTRVHSSSHLLPSVSPCSVYSAEPALFARYGAGPPSVATSSGLEPVVPVWRATGVSPGTLVAAGSTRAAAASSRVSSSCESSARLQALSTNVASSRPATPRMGDGLRMRGAPCRVPVPYRRRRVNARSPPGHPASAQLAVLAAAAVVAGRRRFLAVQRFLARHAQAHAGHGLAPRLGDRRVAFLAVRQARTLRQAAARALDRVLDGRVDLVLHCGVARPSGCHVRIIAPAS